MTSKAGISFRALTLAIIALTFVSSQSRADLKIYFGGPDTNKAVLPTALSTVTPARNTFLSTLSSYAVNDLESVASGANPTLSFSPVGITGTTGFSNGVNSLALFSVSGSKFLYDTEGNQDYIQFDKPITAFGTYITQGGDGPANDFSIRLENSLLGTSKTLNIATLGPSAAFYNVLFTGITDTIGFDRISFIETHDNDGLLYDDLIVGNVAAVPEPTSMALATLAAASFAFSRRKLRVKKPRSAAAQ
jgi:hypothetical protein